MFNKNESPQKTFSSLWDVFLLGNFRYYAYYRLRFFTANLFLVLGVHLAEFWLLTHMFSRPDFAQVIFFRGIALIVEGGWWGSLEVLRERIRSFKAEHNEFKIKKEILNWLALTAVLSCIAFIITGFILVKDFRTHSQSLELVALYQGTILFRLGMNMLTATYHAGAYALRRVYRPFYTIALCDVSAILFTLAFWHTLGAKSLPIALFCSTWISAYLSYYFTTQTYKSLRFFPLGTIQWQDFKWFLGNLFSAELILSFISSAMMALDGIIISIVILSNPNVFAPRSMSLLLYLVTPLIRGNYEWSRLFYFDFKKLQQTLLNNFYKTFNRHIVELSLLVGLVLWIIIIPIADFYSGRKANLYLTLLLPFFILASLTAAAEIEMFVKRRYFDVCIGGLFPIIAILIIRKHQLGLFFQLGILCACLLLTYIYLRLAFFAPVRSVKKAMVPVTLWELLEKLKHLKQSVQLNWFKLNPREDGRHKRAIENLIVEKLETQGEVGVHGMNDMYVYELAQNDQVSLSEQWIDTYSEHVIMDWRKTAIMTNGKQALHFATQNGWFDQLLGSHPQIDDLKTIHQQICNEFKTKFPNGLVIDPAIKLSSKITIAQLEPLRNAIFTARSFLFNNTWQDSSSKYHISALCNLEQIVLVFAIPLSTTNTSEIRAWVHHITEYNCKLALN